jgi:uncharacterized protein (DUF362 family)/Pyruvate/2-oxoacid:ferredoxin oxidoreductase delta subunit
MSHTFKPGVDPKEAVALDKVENYDVDAIEAIIRSQLNGLGISDMFYGKRVAVKPNLVMKKKPEYAATTHPVVLEAMLRILKESASEIIIAESPPGIYSEQTLKSFYNGCGITEVAEKLGIKLNFDTSYRSVPLPDASIAKGFDLISPILDADVIVNLAKLKTHALTKYSGAVKNYFGTVPGIQKVETHARFPDYNDFGMMLTDLAAFHVGSKPTYNLLDGITAMEGNGPTGGSPKKLGVLISGRNPFSVDVAGAHIAGLDNIVMLEDAKRRGYTDEVANLKLICDLPLEKYIADSFTPPDSIDDLPSGNSMILFVSRLFGGRIFKWLRPRPEVDEKTCVGCGECARSCPKMTIEMRKKSKNQKGNKAFIIQENCIKCYCCQELCPFKAVKIRKNPLMKLLGG